MPLAGFSSGGAVQAPMQLAGHRLAFNICYEDSFGDELRAGARQAEALVNLSNLAWFGHSTAADQHLQLSQTRALETGRPMLRATPAPPPWCAPMAAMQARLADFTTGGLRAEWKPGAGRHPTCAWAIYLSCWPVCWCWHWPSGDACAAKRRSQNPAQRSWPGTQPQTCSPTARLRNDAREVCEQHQADFPDISISQHP